MKFQKIEIIEFEIDDSILEKLNKDVYDNTYEPFQKAETAVNASAKIYHQDFNKKLALFALDEYRKRKYLEEKKDLIENEKI